MILANDALGELEVVLPRRSHTKSEATRRMRKRLKELGSREPEGAGEVAETDGKSSLNKRTDVVIPRDEHAIAILLKEPEILPEKLAQRGGVSRSTLYRKSKRWNDVRLTLMARDTRSIPSGTKDRDGNLEAENPL